MEYKTEQLDNRVQYILKILGIEPYKCNTAGALTAHIKTIKNLGVHQFTVERHVIGTAIYTKEEVTHSNGKPQR